MSALPEWVFDPPQAYKVVQDERREKLAYRERLIASNKARIARLTPSLRALVPKLNPLALHDWLNASENVQTSE